MAKLRDQHNNTMSPQNLTRIINSTNSKVLGLPDTSLPNHKGTRSPDPRMSNSQYSKMSKHQAEHFQGYSDISYKNISDFLVSGSQGP
jgi:hypothetical protein